jgi:hypothetical protein
MKTAQENIDIMGQMFTVINNISMMENKIYGYSRNTNNYMKMSLDELRQFQYNLIPEYNKTLLETEGLILTK